MELFKLEVPENKLHPNFKVVKDDKSLIDVINRWSIGFIDRDNILVKEFQTTFNSFFGNCIFMSVSKIQDSKLIIHIMLQFLVLKQGRKINF